MDQKTTLCAGWNLLGTIKGILLLHGKTVFNQVLVELPIDIRNAFRKRIIAAEWYPYSYFSEMHVAYELIAGMGDGTACRNLGRIGGKNTVEHVFSVYLKTGHQRFAAAMTKLWMRHFRNCGSLELVSYEPERTVYHVRGFPQMHQLHRFEAAGYLEGAFSAVGVEIDGDVCLDEVTHDGERCFEWSFAWRPG